MALMKPLDSEWKTEQQPACGDNAVWPAVDWGVGAASSVGALLLLVQCYGEADDDGDCGNLRVAAVGAYAVAIGYAISGRSGVRRRAKCRAARKEHDKWAALSPQQRIQKRDEARAAQGPERQRVEQVCEGPLARWRAEKKAAKKAVLFDRLSKQCKALVTRRAEP